MTVSSTSSSVILPDSREPDDDPRLLTVLKAYQAEWDAGTRPDRARYLSRHPDLACALATYLDSIDMLHRGAAGLSGQGKPAMPFEIGLSRGDRLGEFELVREIGRGGMGVVYEARQPALNRRVAVKVLPSTFAADRVRLQRFIVEAQAAAAVAHPNIVSVFAVGEERGLHYYAMRLVDGEALDIVAARASTHLQLDGSGSRHFPSGGRSGNLGSKPIPSSTGELQPPSRPADVPPPAGSAVAGLIAMSQIDRPAYFQRIAALGAQVARALDHAHQCGVVHRDIKPANLLLDAAGHVWVTDFGLAQLADGPAVTQTGAAIGTLRYMSPEQAAGDRRRLDHRTDVYSLAATLYELATGRPAFPAEEPAVLLRQIAEEHPAAPTAVAAGFPIDLETVLLKALQKEPRDRYASAAEFAADLDRFLNGQPILARRPSVWDRAARWAGRHPSSVAATLVSLVVVVIASGAATALVAQQQAETQKAYDTIKEANEETKKAQLQATEWAWAEKEAREKAVELADAAHRRADEAEKRFQRAKKLGDDILKIAEEQIGADNPLQSTRRKLLLAALENYSALLADKHDDLKVREELDRVASHVKALLEDQGLRREADAAFLLNNPDVRSELRLSSELARKVEREFAAPGKWPNGRPRFPPGPSQETKIELIKALTVDQRQRLRQISFQFRGAMSFSDPEVVDALNLMSWQRHQIKIIQNEMFGGFKQPGPGRKDGPTPSPPKKEASSSTSTETQAKPDPLKKILDLLTPEQQASWRTLCGKPFTPSH